jgi:peptide chain release factor 3
VVDALVELAPPPGPKPAVQRTVQPAEEKFTGVVFKIQANMDPAHRDRVAFVRVCSGRFVRGMKAVLSRTGKDVKTASAMSFLSQRREILDDAWPGDIIGIPNRGMLQLGDTLTEGEKLQFTGLPFFAPEIFHTVEVADPMRNKQLRVGLQQLGEEGAIQVFRPLQGGALLLGAVGPLQLDVVAHRLEGEYQAKARMTPSQYRLARWVTAADAAELERFTEANAYRVAYDVVDAPAVLYTHASELKAARELWPKIEFHTMREHGGLVVHSDKLAA